MPQTFKRGERRFQAINHAITRLKRCNCKSCKEAFLDKKRFARMKEQPQLCSGFCCGNQRKWEGPTLQELRHELRQELSESQG